MLDADVRHCSHRRQLLNDRSTHLAGVVALDDHHLVAAEFIGISNFKQDRFRRLIGSANATLSTLVGLPFARSEFD
jgi:hypothetical protein